MLLHIPNILTREQVATMRAAIDAAQWVDGRTTAGNQGVLVKRNRQLPENSAVALEQGRIILQALAANGQFFSAALPARTMPPLFNRYAEVGNETYGTHVDGAARRVPGSDLWLRTDVSSTLFLCDPEDYDGGELVIRKDDRPETVRDRLVTYHQQTEPLVDFYRKRGKLVDIPDQGSIEATNAYILKQLEA